MWVCKDEKYKNLLQINWFAVHEWAEGIQYRRNSQKHRYQYRRSHHKEAKWNIDGKWAPLLLLSCRYVLQWKWSGTMVTVVTCITAEHLEFRELALILRNRDIRIIVKCQVYEACVYKLYENMVVKRGDQINVWLKEN